MRYPSSEISPEQGTAIVIINSNREVLLVRQKDGDSQYGRNAKDWNIVTETREGEERVKGTVIRALREELGVEFDNFRVIEGTYRETNEGYERLMGYPYKYRCIALLHTGDPTVDPNTLFRSHDGEIMEYKWVHPFLDNYNIEIGAKSVIDYYKALGLFNE